MIRNPRTVCIFVGDLDLARQWYGQALEREPSFYDEEEVAFHVDGCLLSLRVGQPASAPGPVVFWGVDDLPGEYSRLCALSLAQSSNALQRLDADQQTAQVQDPFGNVLGLMAIDVKRERKSRNQRAAEKVALQNVRETLDGLQQADAEQRSLNRIVGWVAGIAMVLLALGSTFWFISGPHKPSPPLLQWSPSSNAVAR